MRRKLVACSRSYKSVADQNKQYAGPQKQIVVDGQAMQLNNVMNAKNVMIDDAFHEIEQAPSRNHRAAKRAARPRHIGPLASIPEQREGKGRYYPCKCVEQAVPYHVDFGIDQRVGRSVADSIL